MDSLINRHEKIPFPRVPHSVPTRGTGFLDSGMAEVEISQQAGAASIHEELGSTTCLLQDINVVLFISIHVPLRGTVLSQPRIIKWS